MMYRSLYFTYPSPPEGFIVIAGFLIAINLLTIAWLGFYIGVEFIDSVLRSVGGTRMCCLQTLGRTLETLDPDVCTV